MPVVNVYKYLGLYFSTRLTFSFACKFLASRAKNALLCIIKKLSTLNNNSIKVFLKLFDSQIQPMLLYGAELWGMDGAAVYCEKVHLYALKRFLGVSLKTPNDLVYGETGRYPISICSMVKCIQYWIKLTQMSTHRLPYKAYRTLLEFDNRGKINWISRIRMKLYELGFDFVWLNQGVQDGPAFIKLFRQRLIDCRWQVWNSHIQISDRFELYRMLNSLHCLPAYMSMDIKAHLKFIMTRFRFGISDIFVHKNRYSQSSTLICPVCKESTEDELHFVLTCPGLEDLREQLIPYKYRNHPCLFKLILLMSSSHENVVKSLAMYLYKAFRRRSMLTD